MRALTLYQPWATLVAIGAKKIETRSWSTKYRGRVAIHVSQKQMKDYPIGFHPLLKGILWREGRLAENAPLLPWSIKQNYHFGCIIAVCELVEIVHIPRFPTRYMSSFKLYSLDLYPNEFTPISKNDKVLLIPPTEPELSFGDYTPGRFAWILENVRKLKEPIPCKGMLGLWNVPEDLTLTI